MRRVIKRKSKGLGLFISGCCIGGSSFLWIIITFFILIFITCIVGCAAIWCLRNYYNTRSRKKVESELKRRREEEEMQRQESFRKRQLELMLLSKAPLKETVQQRMPASTISAPNLGANAIPFVQCNCAKPIIITKVDETAQDAGRKGGNLRKRSKYEEAKKEDENKSHRKKKPEVSPQKTQSDSSSSPRGKKKTKEITSASSDVKDCELKTDEVTPASLDAETSKPKTASLTSTSSNITVTKRHSHYSESETQTVRTNRDLRRGGHKKKKKSKSRKWNSSAPTTSKTRKASSLLGSAKHKKGKTRKKHRRKKGSKRKERRASKSSESKRETEKSSAALSSVTSQPTNAAQNSSSGSTTESTLSTSDVGSAPSKVLELATQPKPHSYRIAPEKVEGYEDRAADGSEIIGVLPYNKHILLRPPKRSDRSSIKSTTTSEASKQVSITLPDDVTQQDSPVKSKKLTNHDGKIATSKTQSLPNGSPQSLWNTAALLNMPPSTEPFSADRMHWIGTSQKEVEIERRRSPKPGRFIVQSKETTLWIPPDKRDMNAMLREMESKKLNEELAHIETSHYGKRNTATKPLPVLSEIATQKSTQMQGSRLETAQVQPSSSSDKIPKLHRAQFVYLNH